MRCRGIGFCKSLLIVLTLLLFNAQGNAQDKSPIQSITMVQLLGNPEKFDGIKIRLKGYCRVEFEGTAIYLNKEDYSTRLGIRFGLTLMPPE
jgi:hypothetical protein